MANHSHTYPRGTIEDLLVKLGKSIFLVYFVVLDMMEDENLPIILGRPFLSTARALVDIYDSKPTLHVEDEAITFEMDPKVSHEIPKDEVSKVDAMEEDLDELVEIEKMMEEELKVWENPHVDKFKCSKPRASIPMTFEVIAFTAPKVQVEDVIDEVEEDLYEEIEVIDEYMGGGLEDPTLVKIELDKEGPEEGEKQSAKAKKQGNGGKAQT